MKHQMRNRYETNTWMGSHSYWNGYCNLCGWNIVNVVNAGGTMIDYISRENAIEAICVKGTQKEREGVCTMTMAEIKQSGVDIISSLPAADVKPVIHGKWVNKSTEDGRFTYKACSVCGFPHRAFFEFNFCSNCGADMRGNDND